MNAKSRKIKLYIGLYVILLISAGCILIFLIGGSKLAAELEIFNNKENSIDQRLRALYAIAQYDEKAATEKIVEALKENNPYIKIEASKLAKARREFEAIPVLIQNLSDNTFILHQASGTSLPMVKIASYDALKSITGRDFGAIESPNPIEVAETIRRWEEWWIANAERLGMETADIEPDYETLILNKEIHPNTRIKYLLKAFRKNYPGLQDVIIGLLEKEKPWSPLLALTIVIASQTKMKQAVPGLITILKDNTYFMPEGGYNKSLPYASLWANEALVQITGKPYGPVYSGMSPEFKKELIRQWEEYWKSKLNKGKTETGREG
jgi:hypothetical protein